jgi:hypothetical protein
MADQKNRGGQKQGAQDPGHADQQQHTHPATNQGRSDQDKQNDQRTNPDDAARQPTDQTR